MGEFYKILPKKKMAKSLYTSKFAIKNCKKKKLNITKLLQIWDPKSGKHGTRRCLDLKIFWILDHNLINVN